MRKTRWLQGAACALAIALAGPSAFAADHLDSPGPKMDPTADITDVYAWAEDTNVLLVLNVSPIAAADAKFSDAIQYALHVESTAAFGTPGTNKDIIATFSTDQKIQLWIGKDEYLTGDASKTEGLESESGKVRVFAGVRADPFYFNLPGFKDAVKFVEDAGALPTDGAGCPTLDLTTATTLINYLKSTMEGAGAAENFFATANVLSIVIEVDKALLNGGGPILAVWASTHKAGG